MTISAPVDGTRVSDWSGTPQRGTSEEYSGKRDPEALRGGTPKASTKELVHSFVSLCLCGEWIMTGNQQP